MKKIMLVDDDKEFSQELGDSLKINGYNVVTVNDAGEALKTAKHEKPDAILLDLKMPKKSGFQVAHELRDSADIAPIPVIAMSACYKNGDFSIMAVHGIKKCLSKPFTPERVIKEIESVLNTVR